MGYCKKYRVKKPAGTGRYGAGQGRCQTCDVWIDHRGGHHKDGSPAKEGSVGWFCNCCNMRVRQKPRHKVYKEKLRSAQQDQNSSKKKNNSPVQGQDLDKLNKIIQRILGVIRSSPHGIFQMELAGMAGITQAQMSEISPKVERIEGVSKDIMERSKGLYDYLFAYDGNRAADESEGNDDDDDDDDNDGPDLSYFSKRRAEILKEFASKFLAHQHNKGDNPQPYAGIVYDMESEFDTSVEVIVKLANTTDPPNKVSLIVAFELLRDMLNRVPTKQDIEQHCRVFDVRHYEAEFESWGHFLEKMGHDPWYRGEPKN